MPVLYNPQTQEPYLRLPAPLRQIIITPHRPHQLEETIAAKLPLLNDPRIYLNLTGSPFPYLREHAEAWMNTQIAAAEPVLQALRTEFETSVQGQRYFGLCPFTVIREVTEEDPETGHPLKDTLIGDIGIARYQFYEYRQGSAERAEAQRLNGDLPAGDERIVWAIGNFLAPSYHGRGIMSLALRTLIQDWGVPRMNVKHLKAAAFEENIGSIRVFEKNNFEVTQTLKDWEPYPENRGGGWKSLVLVSWRGL
ncbi:GNAT family N-acetyltransferase [Aspergillus saccharolyticus JOP 1030-1]|uniref:Acetyltransferase, GNAT family n=1 Tax=Aspergillus saccharolyticus JOP 1030-1 TaxID=1450539 RepID=A0A318Z0L8_9EURO|nr:acetyltransferase, GNAT family [Aspergillus saccharolyticus JOP 1030-1]PYH40459.1 acetyltransferase, GNAT family [Aspergillus saccharolyticus JOP 1030-1]